MTLLRITASPCICFLLGLSFSFYAGPISAERLPDLYKYTALVTSASENTREYQQALVDGLAEVILRSSGDPATLQNPGIIDALGQPTRYLSKGSFETTDEVIDDDGQQIPARRLVLEFSGGAIENLLREFQLPIWPNNRRNFLLWMVADDGQRRRVVSEVDFPEALAAVQINTKRRGLPSIIPLMDLEDQIALSANQVWALAQADIRQASERYNPDTILVVRLNQTSRGEWRTDWNLYTDDGVELFDSEGFTIEDAIASGIDKVTNYFFQRYAINPQLTVDNEAWLFQLGNVQDFSDYMNALSYLEQLTLIRRVNLVAVRGNSLLLYLTADGNVKLLQDTLELDGKMRPSNGSNNLLPLGSVDNPLLYAWQP